MTCKLFQDMGSAFVFEFGIVAVFRKNDFTGKEKKNK
jgi:hypothetical protein